MRVLQRLLFTITMIVGLSLAVSAQKDDKKPKVPPKSDPPVVNPAPSNKPKKPKKSESAEIIWIKEDDIRA